MPGCSGDVLCIVVGGQTISAINDSDVTSNKRWQVSRCPQVSAFVSRCLCHCYLTEDTAKSRRLRYTNTGLVTWSVCFERTVDHDRQTHPFALLRTSAPDQSSCSRRSLPTILLNWHTRRLSCVCGRPSTSCISVMTGRRAAPRGRWMTSLSGVPWTVITLTSWRRSHCARCHVRPSVYNAVPLCRYVFYSSY